ncbi:MAG: hypothetical protein ACFB00_05000 [Parvularculaceae bacterium]
MRNAIDIDRLERAGGGLAVVGLATGAIAGFGASLAGGVVAAPFSAVDATLLAAIFTAAYIAIAERDDLFRPLLPAALAAIAIAGPAAWLAAERASLGAGAAPFPTVFWAALGGPLVFVILTSLAKAALQAPNGARYSAFFVHATAAPVVLGLVAAFAAIAALFLASIGALGAPAAAGVDLTRISAPAVAYPAIGGALGLLYGVIRGQWAFLGALRFAILWACRAFAPIAALLAVAFAIAVGLGAVAPPAPGATLAAAIGCAVVFNGVYQNGLGTRGALARIAADVLALAGLAFAVLAATGFWAVIAASGAGPAQIVGFALAAVASLHFAFYAFALLTELRPRANEWAPAIRPANVAMAAVWAATLTALATPAANLWALSADSHARALADARTTPDDIDFDRLSASFGRYGERVAARHAPTPNPLTSTPHPAAVNGPSVNDLPLVAPTDPED